MGFENRVVKVTKIFDEKAPPFEQVPETCAAFAALEEAFTSQDISIGEDMELYQNFTDENGVKRSVLLKECIEASITALESMSEKEQKE